MWEKAEQRKKRGLRGGGGVGGGGRGGGVCVVSCTTNFYTGRRRIARARRGVCKAGFVCDDAPRAVPSDARHDGWYGPDGRENLATHTTKHSFTMQGF